jgi:DNA-binding cell septation regulator SpoVG
MNVKVKLIQRTSKPHRLADAIVELSDGEGDSLVISDVRILQNKQGQAWVAMPSRSVSEGGRSYQYFPIVESSRQLQRKIEESVLAAFEKWEQSQSQSQSQSESEVRS